MTPLLSEFNADNEGHENQENREDNGTNSSSSQKQAKFKGKIEKLKRLFKKKESEPINDNEELVNDVDADDNFEKVGKVQNLRRLNTWKLFQTFEKSFYHPILKVKRSFSVI